MSWDPLLIPPCVVDPFNYEIPPPKTNQFFDNTDPQENKYINFFLDYITNENLGKVLIIIFFFQFKIKFQ